MRKTSAFAVLFALSCFLHFKSAYAESFTLTASGFDINTGVTTNFNLSLSGSADATAGAYDLTTGSGTVTLSSATTITTENLQLYLPSGTASIYQTARFSQPQYLYNGMSEYDNVIYPTGTQMNGALGTEVDEYGLLFVTPGLSTGNDFYNIFGTGGYAFTDDTIVNQFNSPLFSFNLTQTPSTGITPEPSSVCLLGTGLMGLGGVLRRRRLRPEANPSKRGA